MSALLLDSAGVDFDLSSDQLALQEAATALLERHASHDHLRARIGTGSGTPVGGYDKNLFAAMAEQGWLSVEIPEADGGLGWGMVEVAVLAEQLGRHLACAPFSSTVAAIDALRHGPANAHQALITALSQGQASAAVAFASPRRPLVVEGTGDDVTLSGSPEPVVDGPTADLVVVLDPTQGIFALAGATITPEPAMDRTREIGWLHLDATAAVRLGDEVGAARMLSRVVTAISAEMLGAASAVLELAVGYAKERVQFGRPIGSFQAIKHKLADALVDLEGMRSATYYAAWATATEADDAPLAASMAKAWAGDAARRIVAAGLQVHGGIGFTWEHDMHLYLKRSQLDQVSFGDATYHRDRIASLLAERVEAGLGVL